MNGQTLAQVFQNVYNIIAVQILPDRPGHRPRGADYHQLQQKRWSLEGAWPSISWQLGEEQQRQTENHCSYKERHHGESHHSAETDAGYGQDR